MRLYPLIVSLMLPVSMLSAGIENQVLTSTPNNLQFVVSVDPFTVADLKPTHVLIGLPGDDYPEVDVSYHNIQSFPGDCSELAESGVEWIQKQKLQGLHTGTLKISPYAGDNKYYNQIKITISFEMPSRGQRHRLFGQRARFLSIRILNWDVAQNWVRSPLRKRMKTAVFPSGNWIRFTVPEDNIYSITGTNLLNVSPSLAGSDPRSFKLYTGVHLGRTMSQAVNQPIPDSTLVEIAILIDGEEDGQLNPDDTLFFYGRGASGFNHKGVTVSYHQNLYFTKNTYWLFIPDDSSLRGKRIESRTDPVSGVNIDHGIAYEHVEHDYVNPFQSGLTWVGTSFGKGALHSIIMQLGQPDATDASLTVGLLGGTANSKIAGHPSHKVSVHLQSSTNPVLVTVPGSGQSSWSGIGKRSSSGTFSGNQLTDGANIFILKNISDNEYSQPYFDYLTLRYIRLLHFEGESFEFFSPPLSGQVIFEVTNTVTPIVWEISDITNPTQLTLDESGSFAAYISLDTLSRFIVFSPEYVEEIADFEFVGPASFNTYRNLTTRIEHLVLGPAEFSVASQPLVEHRMNSRNISLEQVYNEFSGGNPDPMAIRSFIQWTQVNWLEPRPLYLLLMGDADYDYRNITGQSKNKVPTIEAGTVTRSHATDDRLATINGNLPEIAIGRYPARTISEVESFVEKLIEYERHPVIGLWRQRVTLVADDGARPEKKMTEIRIGKSHTNNSEMLARLIPPAVTVQKLYMLEYPEVSDASAYGVIKPAATEDLFEILKDGTAIINYIGHGSAHQWAQENLLVQGRDDNSIETGLKLPIWIAGTCSWGHFDDLDNESFSEDIIRQPMNGASAIITTTRLISVSGNAAYLEKIFRSLFPNKQVTTDPIGIILQSVKDGGIEGEYFHLFGDPAMKIPIPAQRAQITSLVPDTLQTLETAQFEGTQSITETGGDGYVILKDADRNVTREYNFLSTVQELSYTLPGATLFRGQFTFTDESFAGQLRIPKDITYSDDPGRLNVYLISNDPFQEALGTRGAIPLGGGNPVQDHQGPIISFETDALRVLRSGDHLRSDELLHIRLSDPLGINITGEVGHEIILSDNNSGLSKDMTKRFIYDPNKITTGTLDLDINDKESRIHLTLKAWDNGNNPAETEIRLSQSETTALKLYHVMNFPNPFSTTTQFTFEITAPAEVSIDIYTLEGRKIYSIAKRSFSIGYHTLEWNGLDAFDDTIANGVYLYRLKAAGDESTVSTIGRLAKFQ